VRHCLGGKGFRVLRIPVASLAAGAWASIACLAIQTAPSGPPLPGAVASVPVSPGSASIVAGDTVQLIATPKDSAGSVLAGRTVTWVSSAPTVASVSTTGLVTGIAEGTATITATSEDRGGTASIAVQPTLGPGARPDPTLLPVAAMQAPSVNAYTALAVPGQPAGFSYKDPVSNVKIWKVTSSTVPAPNRGAGHDYGDGGNQVSRGWGPNHDRHTILIRGDGMSYYLVDFRRGVGFSDYRRLTVQPRRDLCVTFSSVAGFERILYILTGTQLVRYNTQTMQTDNTGNFPLAVRGYAWLHQDRNDAWFTGLLDDNQTVWVWNSQTNQYWTHDEAWTNEPRIDRDGRYVVLTAGGPGTLRVWDLSNNTFGPTQVGGTSLYFSHLASLRSRWVAVNPNVTAPFVQDRYEVSGGSMIKTTILAQSAGADVNNSGNWIQSDAELGGDLNRQWAYTSGVDETNFWANLTLWRQAIGIERADGSDKRLLLHHYTHNPTYFDLAWGQPSPDGKVVIFNSNMYGSGRYDLFVAEVPLR
jgi:Big-like domain-containing protein